MAWTSTHSSSLTDGTGAISLSEVAINDSSKDLVFDNDIGIGSYMQVTLVRIELATTSTSGARLVTVQLLAAGGDVLYDVIVASNSLIEDLSKTWQLSGSGDTAITTPQYVRLPDNFIIHAGQILRIEDSAGIDAAADDMVVHVHGITYK